MLGVLSRTRAAARWAILRNGKEGWLDGRLTMKAIAVTVATIAAATSVSAQPRPNTTTIACSAIVSLVTARGAVVLSTGPNSYDRFVADGSFCDRGQGVEPAFERAADRGQCFVGYRCSRAFAGGRGN